MAHIADYRLEAVLFDLDGTLLDTLEDMLFAVNFCLEQHGLELLDEARAKSWVGHGVERFLANAVGPSHRELLPSVSGTYHRYQATCGFERTRPYPGIEPLLRALKERGIAIAVVTNKLEVPARAMLDKIFGSKMFREIRGARPGLPLKPDAAPARAVLDALRVSPKNSIVVGDTEIDVALAEALGAPSVAVTWGFRPKSFLASTSATHLVDSVDELRALLCGASGSASVEAGRVPSSASERIQS